MQQASQEKADPNTRAAEILAQVEREKAQLRQQTEMAKLELEKQQMELDNARKQLELQMQAFKIQAEAANQSELTRNSQTKTVMDTLDKFNKAQTGQ